MTKIYNTKRLFASLFLVCLMLSSLVLSACVSIYDKDVTVVLVNMGQVQETRTISIFKNALLPDIDTDHIIGETEVLEDGEWVAKPVEFLGWHFDLAASNGMYKASGLCRLQDVNTAVYDNTLVLYAIYGVRVIEKHDLVVAWYGQSTSGLTDSIIDNYETALWNWLEDDQKILGLDIVIKKYIGDVASSCAEVLYDGGADIMLGWGGNLTSLGGIPTLKRQDGVSMGNREGRYIDLIRETETPFDAQTTLSSRVWQWSVDNQQLFV